MADSDIECVACYQPATKVVLGTVNLPACDTHGAIAGFEGKSVVNLEDFVDPAQPSLGGVVPREGAE